MERRMRASTASEPPARSERAKPRASDGVGESEGRRPSEKKEELKTMPKFFYFYGT
jgi:hypothetical protein